ncbi:MAG: cytochrome P450 [Halolamina sp.]
MSATPPGPKGLPLFGNSRAYARDPFRFMAACAETYGDLVRFDLGPFETYMITDPDAVERVLVSEAGKFRKASFGTAIDDLLGDGLLMSDGEQWRQQRTLANPAFHQRRVAALAPMMAEAAEEHVNRWSDGDQVDVHVELARLTVRIIVSAMFGTDVDDDTVRTVQENLEPLGQRFEPDPRRVLVPDWAPTRENREFDAAVETLEGVIDDLVARRVEEGVDGDTAVSELEPDGENTDLLSILLRAKRRGEQTRQEVRDELMTMLLAGHDTTALTLTYTLYLLAEHPEAMSRFHAEVDDVVGDATPTAADARELTFTETVLDESMRLYPPVYALFREPKGDVRLGGYRVPEGAGVMVPQWVIHRSERFYDDPLAFDPDRWQSERASERHRFSFFPFGAGPRHCIGKQLSLLEAKLILGVLGREFTWSYDGPGEFDLRGSLTMHPDGPVPVSLSSR